MKKQILLTITVLCLVAACSSPEPREESPAPVQRYSRPAPKNSYGAIAASRANLATGYAINQDSQEQANRLALDECLKNAEGKSCQVRVHIRNACGAVADAANNHAGYAWGQTIQKAENEALRNCSQVGQNCQISISFCSAQRPATSDTLNQ
jgi:hypothetical protein